MSKALLMILDGWGIGNKSKADVISVTPTPHWDALLAKYPHFKTATARIRKPSVPISGPIDYVEVEVVRHQK